MNQETESNKTSWRLMLGTWMFFVPFVMFFGTPIVIPFLGLSAGTSAAVIGGMLVAAEVIWFASIPLLGKDGFLAMKSKAFGYLKLQAGPISQSRHKFGVSLFWIGLGGQLVLHSILLVAIIMVGANPEELILGLNFEQQVNSYTTVLIICIVSLVVGVYSLGADFAERFKNVFQYQVVA